MVGVAPFADAEAVCGLTGRFVSGEGRRHALAYLKMFYFRRIFNALTVGLG
jgi:hypothetical protein